MPTKTTKAKTPTPAETDELEELHETWGHRYDINGRTFTWTTEDGTKVEIPMRVKLKILRGLSGRPLDAEAMFDMLEKIIPDQAEVLDEMDIVTDFQPMFTTWQAEYNALTGATPGE